MANVVWRDMCLVFIIIIEFHHHHYLLVFLTVNLVLFRRSATYLGLVVPTGLNTSHVLALQARGANAMFKEVEGQQIQIPPLPLHLSLYPRLVTIATNYGSWVPPMLWVEMHICQTLCLARLRQLQSSWTHLFEETTYFSPNTQSNRKPRARWLSESCRMRTQKRSKMSRIGFYQLS